MDKNIQLDSMEIKVSPEFQTKNDSDTVFKIFQGKISLSNDHVRILLEKEDLVKMLRLVVTDEILKSSKVLPTLMDKKCPKCGSNRFVQTLAAFNNKANCHDCGNIFLVDIREEYLSEEQKKLIKKSKMTIITKNGKTFKLKPLDNPLKFKGVNLGNEEEPQLEEINLTSTCPSDCTVHNHVSADYVKVVETYRNGKLVSVHNIPDQIITKIDHPDVGKVIGTIKNLGEDG